MAHLHGYSIVRQRQLQKLQDIRENLNYSETETNGPELLGRLEELFLNWKGYLPYLRDIFGQEVIEHLLLVSVKSAHSNNGSEGRSFVNFVVSSGYKDEPYVDDNGKPVSRRDTVLHCAARLKCEKKIVRQLFDIYHNDKFDVNYVDGSGVSHFHVACEYGLAYAVENFLEHGHDPKCVVPGSGDSTLHMAMRVRTGITVHEYCQSEGIVELLLRGGVDPNLANEKGETPLHIVAQKDYEREMLELFFRINDELNQLVQINARDKSGNTPLHVAMKIQNKAVVEVLLRRGADPTLVNEKGETPLHLICEKDSDGSLMGLFFDVVENIGKTVDIDARDRSNETPLKLALRHKKTIAESLLRNEADPNSRRAVDGSKPLHVIGRKNDDGFVKVDIKDAKNPKVDIDAQDNDGDTPLHLAMRSKLEKATEVLLRRGADLTVANEKGETPWYIICSMRYSSAVETFVLKVLNETRQTERINGQDKWGDTPLHLCLRSQHHWMAGLLLRRGADPTLVNKKGETPLHVMCKSNWQNCPEPLFLQVIDELRLRRREYMDIRDDSGNTALHWALSRGHDRLAEALLRRGADPTVTDGDGSTPLHVVCAQNDASLFQMFFRVVDELGLVAQIDARDKTGRTPLRLVAYAKSSKVSQLECLLAHGADPHSADWPLFLHDLCRWGKIDCIRIFFRSDGETDPRARIDARDRNCNTPLHFALNNGHLNIAKLLLKRGANPILANVKGETPLGIVLGKKRETLKSWERTDDLAIVLKLIFESADAIDLTIQLDTRDKLGNTPLHLTLNNDLRILTKLLLLREADPTLVNAKGETSLDIVCKGRLDDVDLVRMMFKIVDEKRRPVNVDSLLQSTVANGLVNLTKLLLMRGADPTLVNAKGETALDVICKDRRDNVDLVRMMFKIANEKYRLVNVDDLLQSAVANDNVKVTKLLLKRGADPHTRSSDGSSTLYRIFENFSDVSLPRIVAEMIDKPNQPMPVDTRDRWGQHDTLLHLALRNGRKKTAALLLRRDADANLPNAEGETPLHMICRRNTVHLAELFFASMGQRNEAVLLDAQNNRGDTPLHVTLSHGTGRRMAELLLGKGADSTPVNEAGETLLHVVCKAARDVEMAEMLFRICGERGEQVQLDARDHWGNTPLHNLAYAGHDENSTGELLLAMGADPSLANNVGHTPLHIACEGQDIELARTLLNHRRVRVDAPDQEGNTALHLALERQHRAVAELLLRRGAGPNAAKANGETPLLIVCKRGQNDDAVATFFAICDERRAQVEVDAADNLGNTPLRFAVARVLPDVVDLLLNRGADVSRFDFPADFGASIGERVDRTFDDKLKMTCDFLAVVESLENRGYDMERSEALQIMRLFDRHGLLVESTNELEHFWRNDRNFANDAIKQMVKPGLTLYELIRSGPKEAAKLVTLKEFRMFARTVNWNRIRGRNRDCAVYLREKMSRAFFRIWALGSMMELIHRRLPLECCDMIVDNPGIDNKNLYNICLATEARTVQDDNSNSDNNRD